MASVKVAVRVRPLNQREKDLQSKFIIQMTEKKTTITNIKCNEATAGDSSREKTKEFTYDYSYWSVYATDHMYASQQQIFEDLGLDVINNAYEGYNACLFAYGQTGSGKTYTMMGNPGDVGLIPRIGEELFARMKEGSDVTYRTEVSYLEIYNEKVRDLLKGNGKVLHSLRVREHPKDGPYVQNLSKHFVMNYDDIRDLMSKGNASRTTAATSMNDVSSRSHAIFTILFTQATFSKDSPSETHSKIHLVDLAGSERANATGATGQRLKEGGSINKSLVTLGNVISTLADMSEKVANNSRRTVFVPYRDSTLTWLLKDSLGGNAKTIMVANVSPAACNYAETLSTLRYANRAKNIVNKPTVNEDANVRLIRELRAEIERLRTLLGGHIDNMTTPKVQEKLHENEAKVKLLTEKWFGKWKQVANILEEEETLALRKEGIGVVLDSELPHLIGIDDDILSTGLMLYHLKEGQTKIGTEDAADKQDIVLSGVELEPQHCVISYKDGVVTMIPSDMALCSVNGVVVTEPCQLSQGAVILLGKTNIFRFNYPAQAAKLRQEFKRSSVNLSRMSLLSQSMSDIYRSTDNLALHNTSEFDSQQDSSEWHSSQQVALEAAEQEASEKRRTLQRAQQEAELFKADSERAERRQRDEVEKLDRKEQDIQAQLQSVQKRLLQDNDHISNGGECQASHEVLAEWSKRLQQAVEQELEEVNTAEKEANEHMARSKETLQKEIEALQTAAEERATGMERECRQMEAEMSERHRRSEQRQLAINSQREQLERQQQTLKQMEEEKCILEMTLTSAGLPRELDLSADSLQVLQPELDRLLHNRSELATREAALYAAHQGREASLAEWERTRRAELEEEQRQLAADTLYVDECAAQLRLSPPWHGFQREMDAVHAERERIRHNEADLAEKRSQFAVEVAARTAQLQETRSTEVDALNRGKELLKVSQCNWLDAVAVEAGMKEVECAATQAALKAEEQLLEELQEIEKHKEEVKETSDFEAEWLKERAAKRQQRTQNALAAVQAVLQAVDEEHAANVERFQNRRHTLHELGLPLDQNVILTENELCEKQKTFDMYSAQKEAELTQSMDKLRDKQSHLQQMHITQLQLMKEERNELELKLEQLEKAALDARREEAMLSARREQVSASRRRRLSLGGSALASPPYGSDGHLSGVVRTHVRRTLTERTQQQRLTQQRHLERVQEQHQRELAQLRSEYEAIRTPLEQQPTKANPYACVMNGISTVNNNSRSRSSSRSSIQDKSVSIRECSSLLKPIVVTIPAYIHRGSGFDSHYEYELKFFVMDDTWTVYRRYSRFRDLHNDLKTKYPEVASVEFPAKRWFGSRLERIVVERRSQLESYLQTVLDMLLCNITCSLHPSRNKVYSKHVLYSFHSFFRKGLFETGRYETG